MYTPNLDSLLLIQIGSITVLVILIVGQIASYHFQGTKSPLIRNPVLSNLVAIATGISLFVVIVISAFIYLSLVPGF